MEILSVDMDVGSDLRSKRSARQVQTEFDVPDTEIDHLIEAGIAGQAG